MNELIIKNSATSVISLECDSDIAEELIYILEKLLSVSKTIKKKIKISQAYDKASDPVLKAQRQQKFNTEASSVYDKYLHFKKLDYSHARSIKECKEIFNYGYYETEVCITQGRKLTKDKRNADICESHQKGYTLSELAAMYSLHKNTIKNIVPD